MENPEKIVEHKHPEKIKIMVVDDDQYFLKLLSHNIKKLYPSSETLLFGDPGDALNFYRDNYRDIDIIILDMIMPKMNGMELSGEIKKINNDERIILMTAYSLETMIAEKGAEAVEFFLTKTEIDPSLKNFPLLLDFYVRKILWIKESQINYQKSQEELHNKTRLLQLLQDVIINADEASTLEEAMQVCLDKICSHTGWPVGHLYLPDFHERLIPTKIWYLDSPEQFKTFRTITEITPFDSGVGLPGQVFASGKPAWIKDLAKDSNFPRAKLAKDINVKAGFAFPISEGKKVVAVLEFFSNKIEEPDKHLLETMSVFSTQLGRMTERKKAEKELNKYASEMEQLAEERSKQLVHADRMATLGTLSAGIAHEVNNPVGFVSVNLQIFEKLWNKGIKACLEKANRENEDKNLSFALDEMPKMLKVMKEGTRRITNIVQSLGKFSRITIPVSETSDICEIIETAVKFCRLDLFIKHKVKIKLDLPNNIPNIKISRQEMEQVLINVITNSGHAMKDITDGKELILKIAALHVSNNIIIEINDNGCGMDEKTLNNIFNPFFTTKDVGKGRGLGLSICRGIIEQYRGTITARSTLGEETTFIITLPIDPQKKERRKKDKKIIGGMRDEDK